MNLLLGWADVTLSMAWNGLYEALVIGRLLQELEKGKPGKADNMSKR